MTFFTDLERSLSLSRLEAYRLQGGGDEAAICRYLWNIGLCESLYPALQILEIAFRNAVHLEIAAKSGPEWLKAEIAFLAPSELERIRKAKESLIKSGKVVTESFLIAELTFGFWTSLLDVRYDRMWHAIIAGTFPGMPRTIRTRAEVSSRMSAVRKLRNAALHHHSIWHWSDLGSKHRDILILIGWLCPSSSKLASVIDRFPDVFKGGPAQYADLLRRIQK